MKIALILALGLCVTFSFGAAAKDIRVRAYCPMTHVVGIGQGKTFEIAKDAAIKACIDKGGIAACCYKFVRELKA